ncbi:MAG: hypothetical protein KatS3mg108_0481 [Isosphaeraceae bacterium]|jgi:hypothetical protein|nr:MAG: hypothetical protein KatS3mg108_0481 [Isosphaeraceae bacterium]
MTAGSVPVRRRIFLATLALLVFWAGCHAIRPHGRRLRTVSPNPLIVPSDDFETLWVKTVAVLDEYFDIAREDRLARTILTNPKEGATLLEPWYGDSVGLDQRLESTLQTIRRFARVRIDPAPGGGYAVKVEVYKELEDLAKPERQSGGRAVFDSDFPVNRTREIVGPIPIPNGWIPRGRDNELEQVILARLRNQLFL